MAGEQASSIIRIMSFNCWGLKHVSKHREERLRAIAEKLALHSVHYDIVALQEIWVEDDFKHLRHLVGPELTYSKFFYSGILSGPGLCVFSRFPIISASLHPFVLNGRPSAFFRGDWYVGKSIASVVIDHPLQKIEVLATHMHAPYGPGDAAYTCHRTCQAWEMSNMAKRSIASGHLAIVVGDFNSSEDSLTYQLFDRIVGLQDSWAAMYGIYQGDVADLTLQEQVSIAGCTCDSRLNTWRADRQKHEAKRLDYIFYDRSRAVVEDSRVVFTETIPGIGSYSDHFAVEADLRIFGQQQTVVRSPTNKDFIADVAYERQIYNQILDLINEYKQTSIWQKTVRGWHFWLSVVVLVALLVAVFRGAASNRAYVGFIFMLMAIVVTATGLIDGLIALLFGRSEMRSLREFESQIEIARSVLGGT